jgi:predicted ATPase
VPFLKSLRLDGLLSFPPGSEPIPLKPLNVLIGPNGSGKSNLIEGIELLHSTPTGFASAIREGGGVREWLWKGEDGQGTGRVDASVEYFGSGVEALYGTHLGEPPALRYRLSFAAMGPRVEITDEVIEDGKAAEGPDTVSDFYYRFQEGNPVVNARDFQQLRPGMEFVPRTYRALGRSAFKQDESILMQLKDRSAYPELTELGSKFEAIRSFREWSFGRDTEVRKPQRADLPADGLSPDSRNLGLILNQ